MSGVEAQCVTEDEAGLRLDRWFRNRFPALSHGRLQKLLRTGQVRVEGKRAKAGDRLSAGQAIRVPPLKLEGRPDTPVRPAPPSSQEAEALRARILHMDDWLIAIDKPAGLAVQGGSGQARHLDALSEALRFGADEPPRLVHRLDKDTSGVLLLARSARAARALSAAFRDHAARKTYWAAVAGVPSKRRGVISIPLLKRPLAGRGQGERVTADPARGREAETRYAIVQSSGVQSSGVQASGVQSSGVQASGVQASGKAAAWLALWPLTGRTHQLRVHCAAIGHPILGDGKHGGAAAFLSDPGLARQLHLHAREIAIPHPEDGTTFRIAAPLPPHMETAWRRLRFDARRGDLFDDPGG